MKRLIILFTAILLFAIIDKTYSNQSPNQINNNIYEESTFFDSLNVRFVGNWPFGQSYHVDFDSLRNLIFLSSGGGVYILDVSDPTNPVKVSESIHSRECIYQDISYDPSTQRLYLAVSRWFEIWDVSNPNSPLKLGSFSTSGPPTSYADIYASGSYAYCIDDSCFSIVDVSSPSNPQIVSRCDVPGSSVAVKDSFAYTLSISSNGFHVIDISDPENPEIITFLWQNGTDISISGSYAYISTWLGLKFRIIDISDPYNPQFAGFFDSPDDVYHAHVIDSIAYLATELGLRIVNISDPMNPQELGYFYSRGRDVFTIDTIAYLADRDTGLRIMDVSSLSSPQEISNFVTPGISNEVCISGSFAYIANSKGLWIIDVSDPGFPREVGRCCTTTPVYDISLSGSYAYTTTRDSGLIVFDISDPSNTEKVSSLYFPHLPEHYGLDISGNYCYVANGWNGRLHVIDIANPSFPYEVGQCSLYSYSIDVDVSGLNAYVIGDGLFSVVDISDPANPYFVGASIELAYPSDICISGTYAFIVDIVKPDVGRFIVFDISNNNPVEIANMPHRYAPTGIHISGLYAFYSGLFAYLEVIDISQPSNPSIAGYYYSFPYNFFFNGVYALGTNVYISSDCGLQIYQYYGADIEEESEKITSASPSFKLLQNPIRGKHINIQLLNWSKGNVDLCLYNILGQKIKTYTFNVLNDNKNNLQLNIHDITSGIYFLRLEGQSQQSEKLIIMK